MPPVSVSKHFTYLVVGGGSGGIASARRAAEFKNVTVGLVERTRLGGTCVNVGCVPKKLMFHAAMHAEELHDLRDFGFDVDASKAAASFEWTRLKEKRDAYIKKLNGIYGNNLDKSNVELIRGTAKFVGEWRLSDWRDGELVFHKGCPSLFQKQAAVGVLSRWKRRVEGRIVSPLLHSTSTHKKLLFFTNQTLIYLMIFWAFYKAVK